MKDIVVLVPAYNPDQKMITMVNELYKEFEHIVVVNDGCDRSFDTIFKAIEDKATILKHEVNRGKGRALKTGFTYIRDNLPMCKGVVSADADGQHRTSDIVKCCERFLENPTKAVFGCRDFHSDIDIPPKSRFGNRLTSSLLKFFCDIELSDTQTGLRVIPTNILNEMIEIKGDRYEYEMNQIFTLNDLGVSWSEVAIEIVYIDDNASSHFNPIKDSFRIYKVFGKFCLSSFGSSIIDLAVFWVLSTFVLGLCGITGYILVWVATAIARICSGVFNYLVNRWIFGNKSKIKSSGPKYLLLWLIQMACSALIVSGIALLLPINTTIIKVFVDVILFFISYKIQQKWVFV